MFRKPFVFLLLVIANAGFADDQSLDIASTNSYLSYGMPSLPDEIEEVNDPLELQAVRLGSLSCSDFSGEGVQAFLKSGRHPKKYSAGKLKIRVTKPVIARQLRFRDGSPGHLTVKSFKDNCLNTLVSSKPQNKQAVRAVVTEQTKNLAERIDVLEAQIKALESRLDSVENRR